MKKRLAFLLCCLILLPASSFALTADAPLAGAVCWPDGTDESSAAYVYRYEYPRFLADSSAAEAINVHFQYLVDDALAFAVPMTVAGFDPSSDSGSADITGRITCLNEDYLSVLITSVHTFNGETRTVTAGHTFPLQGSRAGSATNLPRFLGLLNDDETDEWLLDRQTNKANDIVRAIIWRKITAMQQEATLPLFDDLTEDTLAWSFYPEEDFYLDADGQPVFFLQPGTIAPPEFGLIEFPLTLDEIDDEL